MDLEVGGVEGRVTIIMMHGMRGKKSILNKSGGVEWYNPEMIHYVWSVLPTEFHIVILSIVASFSRRVVPGACSLWDHEWVMIKQASCSTALSPRLAPRAFPLNPSHHSWSGQTASKVPPPGSIQNAFPHGHQDHLRGGTRKHRTQFWLLCEIFQKHRALNITTMTMIM